MLRTIGAVVVGYLAMVAAVFTTFTFLYLYLGADRAFQPDAWGPSSTWVIWTFVLGLIAAIIGGIVCALVARAGSKAPLGLVGLIVVLSAVQFVVVLMTPDDPDKPQRTSETKNFEAMGNAEAPLYTLVVNPLLGVVGVLIGGKLPKKKGKGGEA